MRNLNTRRWSTPLTMGAGLFVVITGLLMFFVAERPFKFAHELTSMCSATGGRSATTSPSVVPSVSSRSRGRGRPRRPTRPWPLLGRLCVPLHAGCR